MGWVFSRLLGREEKSRLDPKWVERIERRYEVAAGYADYHESCRSCLERSPAGGPFPLVEDGRERLRVTSVPGAREIEREVLERFTCSPTAKKSQHLLRFDIDDVEFERTLLERILTAEVDERALRFFGSEYFVFWYHVTRSVPVPELGLNSFRWHCDRGPRGHLKLLFYLNGWEEHDGGTECLDLDTTQKIASSGYVFAPVKTRVTDLGPLAEQVGASYAPWSPRMQAGEGILFQPAGVLHRGLLSKRGPRHVVTICMLPSPVPWREAFERGALAPMRGEDKWHEDASQLRRRLARGAAR